jgi:hypothetical protein
MQSVHEGTLGNISDYAPKKKFKEPHTICSWRNKAIQMQHL